MHFNQGNGEASARHARLALELGREAGDQYGIGNALNVLSSTEVDLAQAMALLQRAIEAFDAAGYAERRVAALSNLANAYLELGLYRHARRLQAEAAELARSMGAQQALAYTLSNLCGIDMELGALDAAERLWQECAAVVAQLGDPAAETAVALQRCELDLAAGDAPGAARHAESALRLARRASPEADASVLTRLGEVRLANGDAAAALAATTEATALHRAQAFARPSGGTGQDFWWWHMQALRANGREAEAHAALVQAHALLLEGIANLHDEGLRRSDPNKVAVNRRIVRAWLDAARERGLPRAERLAHLAIHSNPREPFRRLADTGLRLNALPTVAAIQAILVEEATELCGGERVVLVLEDEGVRRIVEAQLPPGEDGARPQRAITPLLDRARTTRSAERSAARKAAGARRGLSRVVAPLVVQNVLLGYLYADTDAAYGAFTDTDRDMLGVLAQQAASRAFQPARRRRPGAQGGRTTAELAQRAGELAVINSIQQGMAAELDFQAIVDLVGDKLREVFGTGDIAIDWLDQGTVLVTPLYVYEHGMRLSGTRRSDKPKARATRRVQR